jgi:hypothetical protein
MNKQTFKYTAVAVGVLLFAASAVFKLIDPVTQAQLAKGGFSIYPLIALQTLILVLYVLPQTFRIGFYLVCCYMGGAIAYSFGTSAGFAIVTTIALWIGAYVREPGLFGLKRISTERRNVFAASIK